MGTAALVDSRSACSGIMPMGMSPHCAGNTFIDRDLFTTSFLFFMIFYSGSVGGREQKPTQSVLSKSRAYAAPYRDSPMSPLFPFLLWTGFFVPLYLRSPGSSDLPWLSSASWLLSVPQIQILGQGNPEKLGAGPQPCSHEVQLRGGHGHT